MKDFGTRIWRPARRVSDANATLLAVRPFTRVRGFTLIELLTTIGLLAVVAGMAIPHMPRGTYDLWTTQVQFLSDMRRARTSALTMGDHYRVVITANNHYEVRRMQLQPDNVTWLDRPGAPLISRTFGSSITFTSGVNNAYEFNTRGLLVIPTAVFTISMYDARTLKSRNITVWPSGQVSPA